MTPKFQIPKKTGLRTKILSYKSYLFFTTNVMIPDAKNLL